MNTPIIRQTSLETTTDIKDTLNWKLSTLQEDGKDISTNLADYFYRADMSLNGQLDQLKELEAEIKQRKTTINEQISAIKVQGASFLTDNGIDSLTGNLASSITITKGKPAGTKQKFIMDCTTREMQRTLLGVGLGHIEKVDVAATVDKIRINRRKSGTVTVDE